MKKDTKPRGRIGLHSLRQQGADDAREHIAGTGCRKPGRRIGIDHRLPAIRHDRIRPLVDDHGTRAPGRGHGPVHLAQRRIGVEIGKQPGKLALMRGEN